MEFDSRDVSPYFGKTIKTKSGGYRIDRNGIVYELFSYAMEHGTLFRIAGIKKQDFETTEAGKRFRKWKQGEYTFSENIKHSEIYLPIFDELIENCGRSPEIGHLLILGINSRREEDKTIWNYRAFSEITDILEE